MPHYIIYMYTFPNDKKYIGKSTKPLKQRQGRDWTKYETCTLLWKAILKYGTENIRTNILFEGDISHEEAAELERKYIAEYKTNVNRYKNPQYGYNLTDGGEGLVGWHPSPERYELMMKLLEKAKDVRLSMPMADSTREKMRNAKLGKKGKDTNNKKMVIATNLNDGTLMIFDTHLECANYFEVSNASITRWVKKEKKPRIPYRFDEYTPRTTKQKEADVENI